MIIIGKHINGITINPLEYLLDDTGKPMEFTTVDKAMALLRKKGGYRRCPGFSGVL